MSVFVLFVGSIGLLQSPVIGDVLQ
jgi:hypothetical protein